MQKQTNQIMDEALSQLATVFELKNPMEVGVHENDLWIALEILSKSLNIQLVKPPETADLQNSHELIAATARSSGFRFRATTLSHQWWNCDNGPLLLFEAETDKPYALIFHKSGRYRIYDPDLKQFTTLSRERIARFSLRAYSFYRKFPNQKLKLRDVFSFALFNQKRDLFRIVLTQIFIGLLGLFLPIATGILLDQAVPNANMSLLTQCTFALFASSFSIALFHLAQNFGLIRLRFKTNASVQPAVWDRLLNLPTAFFQRYSPGDLSLRASGIDAMQEEITSSGLQALLNGLFSFLNFGLMIYYSYLLAAWSLILILIILVFIVLSNLFLLRYERPIMQLQGKLAALSFQFLVGISKLRISNSEARAFSNWLSEFGKKTRLLWASSLWMIRFEIIHDLFSILMFIALYALIGTNTAALTFGAFIAFNAAFGQFFTALLSLANVFSKFSTLVPLYERINPILEELPEQEGKILYALSGKISVQELNFHYHLEQLPVLENISLEVNEGEFIAITGATGSGKSTLFRLLLGFETATKGQIYYDNHNLNKLNKPSLREQCGVVLQNGFLFPGTIFENIVGNRSVSMEAAWEAARLAALDEDIKAMPMEMHTLLSERGATFSVGQRQRLMIARALFKKPRILLLDEATSALDNLTQTQVMQNIEQLKITRIIAAHRLSTLMKADRIYVLDKGRVVQSGTYKELIQKKGIFADLVKEQRVDMSSLRDNI